MIPINLWEHQNGIKTLYSHCVEQVCERNSITRMELDILLFLANNPAYDTATDIIEIRFLSKSQVSASIKLLEQKGYLEKEYRQGNRKTAHLRICGNAEGIIADGRRAQREFFQIMFCGIDVEELEQMKQCHLRILENIHRYMKENKDDI